MQEWDEFLLALEHWQASFETNFAGSSRAQDVSEILAYWRKIVGNWMVQRMGTVPDAAAAAAVGDSSASTKWLLLRTSAAVEMLEGQWPSDCFLTLDFGHSHQE